MLYRISKDAWTSPGRLPPVNWRVTLITILAIVSAVPHGKYVEWQSKIRAGFELARSYHEILINIFRSPIRPICIGHRTARSRSGRDSCSSGPWRRRRDRRTTTGARAQFNHWSACTRGRTACAGAARLCIKPARTWAGWSSHHASLPRSQLCRGSRCDKRCAGSSQQECRGYQS
jgi:hypothetical protein